VEPLELSANSGYAPAQFTLGFLLYHGATAGDDLLPSDHARAMPWLLKSAERGSPAANDLVGRAYLEGHVLPHDVERAKRLLTVAANARIGSAQVGLAAILDTEPRLAQALEAYKWLWLAAGADYPGAAENLAITATRLNQTESEQARVLAANIGLARPVPNSGPTCQGGPLLRKVQAGPLRATLVHRFLRTNQL